jgi:lysophospholipase L1-like esterase
VLGVLAAIALMQCGPEGPIYSCPSRLSAGRPFSFSLSFQTACACDGNVVDNFGRQLTFDGGAAYCTKHNEWTDIAPGDMVLCADGMPRVMPGGDGGGTLGIQVWPQRQNAMAHSQAIDHADWTKGAFSVAAPTVQANACASPDGTMNGEIVHWPAVTGGVGPNYSYIYQAGAGITFDVRTIYARSVKPDGGPWEDDGGVLSGGFAIADGALAYAGINCSYTSAGFTRCRQFDTDAGQVGAYMYLTIDGQAHGTTPAQDVCLWQADVQTNTEQMPDPWPPPIKTVASAVTRMGDVAWFDGVLMPQRTSYVLSASLLTEGGYWPNANRYTLFEATTPTGARGSKVTSSGPRTLCAQGADIIATLAYSTNTLTASEADYSCSYDGEYSVTACSNGGSCGDAGIDAGVAIATRFAIGSSWNGFDYISSAAGVVKNISATEPARKDIYLFGDSIVEGHTAGEGFEPQYIIHRVRGNRVAILNEGVSTYNTAQCRNTFMNRLNLVVDAGNQARSYFMMQCGHNGIDDAGCVDCGAGVGVLGDLTDALARARDAGIHIIGSTVPPQFTSRSYIVPVNTSLRSWGASNGVVIAETYNVLEEAPPGSGTLAAAYAYDDTHLNDAGTWVETNVWMNAGGW